LIANGFKQPSPNVQQAVIDAREHLLAISTLASRMDPLTNLYQRLRQSGCGRANIPTDPPALEDWLRYWNDEDTDLGNLRNFEHWLSVGRVPPITN
jgi:hypothetical protein